MLIQAINVPFYESKNHLMKRWLAQFPCDDAAIAEFRAGICYAL
jgi:hypothetical protein